MARGQQPGVRGLLLGIYGDWGDSSDFRDGMRALEVDYAVGVHGPTKVWRMDTLKRRRGEPISLRDLALELGRTRFRRITWREGTKQTLWSRFAFLRVIPAHDDGWDPAVREDVWLVIEWPDGEREPTKYFFATMPPSCRRKTLVRLIKERYRTERLYEDLKGELGLDHFEGRSFPAWHHHVSVVLSCYAFVVAERVRRFSPSAGWPMEDHQVSLGPERHFHDSFITARIAIARLLATWLPRCPLCHRANPDAHAHPGRDEREPIQ